MQLVTSMYMWGTLAVPDLGKPWDCPGKIVVNCAYCKLGCDIAAPLSVSPAQTTWQLLNHRWVGNSIL